MLEKKLRDIIEYHLNKVLDYDPFERFEDVKDKDDFLKLIENDPAFFPFFLNNEKYVTARVGGNLITSLHRKLGDLYEEIFQVLLEVLLNIPEEDLLYSVELNIDGNLQKRSTDGIIRYERLSEEYRKRVLKLAAREGKKGIGFEVRSCYQIGDSKRIQADRDLALALEKENLEPVMIIFCTRPLNNPSFYCP